ncbi:MAG: hypothetical protein K8J31_27780 [Anaerolineae bacterium]|nr:hypothetical protein [Anaerolineae bacterium]
MPIPVPSLDDRTFDDLVEEARALIPLYAPEWTNHNPSDPGITLIELFAWLAEMLIYRADQVTDEHYKVFLKLLKGPKWNLGQDIDIEEEIRRTMTELREPWRAVTCADYEQLVLKRFKRYVARVKCFAKRNLEASATLGDDAPGHMSVIVVPKAECNLRGDWLCRVVKLFLNKRRLLTTRLHVVNVESFYVHFTVKAIVQLREDIRDEGVDWQWKKLQKPLEDFLDPIAGRWPFGRSIYESEIIQFLEQIPQVDNVSKVILSKNGTQTGTNGDKPIVLQEYELPLADRVTVEVEPRTQP